MMVWTLGSRRDKRSCVNSCKLLGVTHGQRFHKLIRCAYWTLQLHLKVCTFFVCFACTKLSCCNRERALDETRENGGCWKQRLTKYETKTVRPNYCSIAMYA